MNRIVVVMASGVLAVVLLVGALTSCGGGNKRQVLQNKGSDTLVNVAQAWAEAYPTVEPNTATAVTGGGSCLNRA